MKKLKNVKGFTLIEILVVIALIAVLATITIIAINPAKNFADARNTQRTSDVNTILNAVTQYTSEQGHTLAGLGTIPLCTATPAHIGTGAGNVDLGAVLVDTYVVAIPKDPTSGTDADTNYTICSTAATSGRVEIKAPGAENGVVITVKR
jgi:prepilin-type N-terminal cleavage/methylation domain-containing protein